jgi:hypothetical protein
VAQFLPSSHHIIATVMWNDRWSSRPGRNGRKPSNCLAIIAMAV